MKTHTDIFIKGKVREADFNYYALKAAMRMNVNVVYKNGDSRHVDIEVEGDASDVQSFVNHLKTGPLKHYIEHFETREGKFKNIEGYTSLRVHKDKQSLLQKLFGKKKQQF